MLTNKNIIKAKLYPPKLPNDFVIRKEINKELEERKDSSIFLFSAPSGYGKSSSVVNWLQSSEVEYCWVSIDKNDNELKVFIKYIILAIQSVSPKFGMEIEQVIESNQDTSLNDYQILFSNAVTTLEKEVYLVLDDYHIITNNEIHDLLIYLFKYPQHKLHLVMTSRIDPPFPFSKWRMKNKVSVGCRHLERCGTVLV